MSTDELKIVFHLTKFFSVEICLTKLFSGFSCTSEIPTHTFDIYLVNITNQNREAVNEL